MCDLIGCIVTTTGGIRGKIVGKVKDEYLVETGKGGQILYVHPKELTSTVGDVMDSLVDCVRTIQNPTDKLSGLE